jgi:hypothetical protein
MTKIFQTMDCNHPFWDLSFIADSIQMRSIELFGSYSLLKFALTVLGSNCPN